MTRGDDLVPANLLRSEELYDCSVVYKAGWCVRQVMHIHC